MAWPWSLPESGISATKRRDTEALSTRFLGRFKGFMKQKLFITAGSLFLAFGVVGIFVPVLPTTPFLLLSAWFWLRSSRRLYDWLINHKYLGKYIHDYMQERKIPLRVKVYTLILMWASMLLCIFYFLSGRLCLQLLLLVAAIGVTIHVLKLRS